MGDCEEKLINTREALLFLDTLDLEKILGDIKPSIYHHWYGAQSSQQVFNIKERALRIAGQEAKQIATIVNGDIVIVNECEEAGNG